MTHVAERHPYASYEEGRIGSNRRSSIGSTTEPKYFPATMSPNSRGESWPLALSISDDDELSECSTIISHMELSSFYSHKRRKTPVSPEDDDEISSHVLKDSILLQYDKKYTSPNSPKKDTLKIPEKIQQQLRFCGLEQALESPTPLCSNPKWPESPDRRKMMSRWASMGHLSSTADGCGSETMKNRDKPPTSPVRSSLEVADDPLPTASSNDKLQASRRASTGVLSQYELPVVKVHQEHTSYKKQAVIMNDKAPTCPDRRKHFHRRKSTGSSDSLESMVVYDTDEDKDDAQNEMKKNRKSKSLRGSKHFSGNKSETSRDTKGSRKKSKKKSKEKKEKSSKKVNPLDLLNRPPEKERPVIKCQTKEPGLIDGKGSTHNESLLSLLKHSNCTPSPHLTHVIESPESDLVPVSPPARIFSRRASTGIISGDGVVPMRKAKFGGTTSTPVDAKSPIKNMFAKWGTRGQKS